MERSEVITSIVLSAHALARIAAQDAGNDAPSAQWRVLTLLEHIEGMRIGLLARAARTTQPGMTKLVGDMERTGYVSRSADPADSRATVAAITDAGRQALTDWRSEFRDTLAPRFTDLTEDDWRTLGRAAEILAVHSQEQTAAEKTGDAE